MPPLLTVEGLRRVYRPLRPLSRLLAARPAPVVALDEVSLTLDAGEWALLVGPNGSGKSTLLRVAAGLLVPTAGRLRVAGVEPYADDPRGRRAVGSVFADSRSFSWRLSGRENLRFFAALHGLVGRAGAARVDEVLAAVGLADLGERRVMAYSSGMRQRLSVARALLHRPRLLLLDEVTDSLDRDFVRAFLESLHAQVQQEGVAILYATHRPDEVQGYQTRTLYLEAGRVVPPDGGNAPC